MDLGAGYNRNAITLILAEVGQQYGQQTVDDLIDEFLLEQNFAIRKGKVYQ